MSTVMTSAKFIKLAKDVAAHKTLYVMGGFGAPLTAANKKRYIANYAYNAQSARKKLINAASADTFAFDCVNLIKGILWGWDGDTKKTYGGAVYGSNGVPDVGADGMMSYCTDVSTDFSKIEAGEVVHMNGHIGIYIGNGLAIESTPIWKDGVQITAVGNIGKKKGYNTRTWTNHGKLKFIKYPAKKASSDPLSKYTDEQLAEKVIKGEFGDGSDRKNALGDRYAAVQKIVDQKLSGKTESTKKYYTVKKGDTLSGIAAKYGADWHDLAKLNDLKNPSVLQIGQKIRIK